jgi:hypothetical protein
MTRLVTATRIDPHAEPAAKTRCLNHDAKFRSHEESAAVLAGQIDLALTFFADSNIVRPSLKPAVCHYC